MSHRNSSMIRTVLLFLIATSTSVFAVAPIAKIPPHQSIAGYSIQKKVDQVLFLVQKRLSIMHEVARTKWNQNLAIEDLAREQQIIASLVKQGQAHGMDEAWIRKFFQAQFDAAKLIQQYDMSTWSDQKEGKFESVLDLKQDIRPYLDQLSTELMTAVANLYNEIKEGKISALILPKGLSLRSSDYIEEEVWQLAVSPLVNP